MESKAERVRLSRRRTVTDYPVQEWTEVLDSKSAAKAEPLVLGNFWKSKDKENYTCKGCSQAYPFNALNPGDAHDSYACLDKKEIKDIASKSRLYNMSNLEIATDYGTSLANKGFISQGPQIDYWKSHLDNKNGSEGHANYIASHLRNLWNHCGWSIADCFALCDKMGIEIFKEEGDDCAKFYWSVRDDWKRVSQLFSDGDFDR